MHSWLLAVAVFVLTQWRAGGSTGRLHWAVACCCLDPPTPLPTPGGRNVSLKTEDNFSKSPRFKALLDGRTLFSGAAFSFADQLRD